MFMWAQSKGASWAHLSQSALPPGIHSRIAEALYMSRTHTISLLSPEGEPLLDAREHSGSPRLLVPSGHLFSYYTGEALIRGTSFFSDCLSPEERKLLAMPNSRYDPASCAVDPTKLRRVFEKLHRYLRLHDEAFPISFALRLTRAVPHYRVPDRFKSGPYQPHHYQEFRDWVDEHWSTHGFLDWESKARVRYFEEVYDRRLEEIVYRIRIGEQAYVVRGNHADLEHRKELHIRALDATGGKWVDVMPPPYLDLNGARFMVEWQTTFEKWEADLGPAIMVCTLAEAIGWKVAYCYQG